IGQREINDAEFAAEGHRRLGPPVSELLESRTASACQNKRQRIAGQTADETSRAGSCHFDCPPCVNEVEPCARAFARCNLTANILTRRANSRTLRYIMPLCCDLIKSGDLNKKKDRREFLLSSDIHSRIAILVPFVHLLQLCKMNEAALENERACKKPMPLPPVNLNARPDQCRSTPPNSTSHASRPVHRTRPPPRGHSHHDPRLPAASADSCNTRGRQLADNAPPRARRVRIERCPADDPAALHDTLGK